MKIFLIMWTIITIVVLIFQIGTSILAIKDHQAKFCAQYNAKVEEINWSETYIKYAIDVGRITFIFWSVPVALVSIITMALNIEGIKKERK